MNTLVIASTETAAGKTSFILGLAATLGNAPAYLKPLGDRLIYSKKRFWDSDSDLMTKVFKLEEDPEQMSLGFDPLKIRSSLGSEGISPRLRQAAQTVGAGRDWLLVETGGRLDSGASIGLASWQVCAALDAKLILVCPDSDATLDHLLAWKEAGRPMPLALVFSRVRDLEEFKDVYQPEVEAIGFKVAGIIPYNIAMTRRSLNQLSNTLLAKPVAASKKMNQEFGDVVIGAAQSESVLRKRLVSSDSALVLTSGDRADMVLASLEMGVKGVVLSNGILPSSTLLSLAEAKGIPLLSTQMDTYQVALRVEGIAPCLEVTREDLLEFLKKSVSAMELQSLGLN